SVSYTMVFSKPVTGVDPSDFLLATTGTVGTTLTQVTPAGPSSVYTVTVSGISGSGTLGLNLVDDSSIRDQTGNPLTKPNATASFQNQVTFATGAQPASMALGDVNADGKPDLAIANHANNSVGVLLNNGNGTFQTQTTFATGGAPSSVAMGDFNADS